MAAAMALCVPAALAGTLAPGYTMQTYPVAPDGQFTAYDGLINSWTASGGYRIYDVSAGTTTTIGLPPNGVNTNGWGDAFGVLDPVGSLFYAGTVHGMSSSDVYTYNLNTSTWLTPGQDGVPMANAYGAQVHNGQLYVAGLSEPWNGGYGQDNYIFAFDHAATPGGDSPRHDTLIQTSGNSANLAVAPNGDVYYGTYDTNILYCWTAAQVASVMDNLYADGAVDHFLTLADGSAVCALPGGSNGLAVDAGGNVFFAVNGFDASWNLTSTLAMLDSSAPLGYRGIYTGEGYANWFGAISVDGDFLDGDPLYFSPTFGGDLAAIQGPAAAPIPEPLSLALFGTGLIGLAGRHVRRRQRA
jgi:hypothetical protein